MAYNYLNQAVLASTLCLERDADSFFRPVALNHTGFAADGQFYNAGVVSGSQVASWNAEPQSATRGPLPTFPTQALVIVNRASVAILDATTDEIALWMLFYCADDNAHTDNAQKGPDGYIPTAVTWANGRLSITLSPDAGSTLQMVQVTTFDFVADAVYIETIA